MNDDDGSDGIKTAGHQRHECIYIPYYHTTLRSTSAVIYPAVERDSGLTRPETIGESLARTLQWTVDHSRRC